MKNRIIFPVFNALMTGLMGTLVGYYVFRPWTGLFAGLLAGLLLAGLLELLFGLAGSASWIYHRRVLLTVLLELPLAIFVAGPWAYVETVTLPSPAVLCCETPLDYGASSYETLLIDVPARLDAPGITLNGWYVPPAHSPGPLVVLLHGSHGNRLGLGWHARQLIAAGYGIYMYDQRAMGESTGEIGSLGWFDAVDLLVVLQTLGERPDVDPQRIGAAGFSLGAQIALTAAYRQPGALHALWLDGIQAQGVADLPEPENFGEQFATFINGLLIKAAEIKMGSPAPPPFSSILKDPNLPPMVILSAELDPIEARIGQKYAHLLRPTDEFWLVANAYHTGGPLVLPEKYATRMLGFFNQHLGVP